MSKNISIILSNEENIKKFYDFLNKHQIGFYCEWIGGNDLKKCKFTLDYFKFLTVVNSFKESNKGLLDNQLKMPFLSFLNSTFFKIIYPTSKTIQSYIDNNKEINYQEKVILSIEQITLGGNELKISGNYKIAIATGYIGEEIISSYLRPIDCMEKIIKLVEVSANNKFELDREGYCRPYGVPSNIEVINGDYESHLVIIDDSIMLTTLFSHSTKRIDLMDSRHKLSGLRNDFFNKHSIGNRTGYRDKFVCHEHFVKIANGTRLLHYLDNYDEFEVFDLPEGWRFKDGVINLSSPKVFNEITYDNEDKDLPEIYNILSARKKGYTRKLVSDTNK